MAMGRPRPWTRRRFLVVMQWDEVTRRASDRSANLAGRAGSSSDIRDASEGAVGALMRSSG